MDFHPDPAAIHYRSHVGGDHSVHARLLSRIKRPAGRLQIFLIQDNVQRQIGLHPVLPADPDYFVQVLRLEVVG